MEDRLTEQEKWALRQMGKRYLALGVLGAIQGVLISRIIDILDWIRPLTEPQAGKIVAFSACILGLVDLGLIFRKTFDERTPAQIEY